MSFSIKAPQKFTVSATDKFLKDIEFVFGLVDKYKSNGKIHLEKITNINLVNVLIIYKIISFASENRCIVDTEIVTNDPVIIEFIKYGLYPLLLSYVNNVSHVEHEYKHLGVIKDENFLIAPQALIRNDSHSHETIRKEYLPAIEQYYNHNPKVGLMILTCLSEILLNFWEHAIEDDRTVIIAYGTKDRIEIACADNGEGILSTLAKVYPKVKTKKALLMSALKKGVTSKKSTNHMGYGLWLVNEIATRVKGRLHIFSQGGHVMCDYGKMKYLESGNWKGTIVYLDLPLREPVTISDIEQDVLKKSAQQVKINWV